MQRAYIDSNYGISGRDGYVFFFRHLSSLPRILPSQNGLHPMPNSRQETLTLDQLQPAQIGVIVDLDSDNTHLKYRLQSIGFIPGETLQMLRTSPFGDPIEVEIMGTRFCLRKSSARHIRVRRMNDDA